MQKWQQQRLGQLGTAPETASRVVRAAWMDGEHTDLVHRIENLVQPGGATLDQAARIVVSVRSGRRGARRCSGGGHDAGG